jgi:catabolite regulation protein CreA
MMMMMPCLYCALIVLACLAAEATAFTPRPFGSSTSTVWNRHQRPPPLYAAANNRHNKDTSSWQHIINKDLSHKFATGLTALILSTASVTTNSFLLLPRPAFAYDSRVIGEISGSGFIFKDTLEVESFDDPKVKGVTLYISNFQRPLAEKISKGDFFSDPSYASVSCAKTGSKIQIADNINTSRKGEEVFEESKSLLFKTLRVQRIYDQEKNTVVYVSFNTRLDKSSDANKSRFKSSICAVPLE